TCSAIPTEHALLNAWRYHLAHRYRKRIMDQRLTERLNQLPEKMLDNNFLTGRGLGNEVRFWIFKYQPQAELEVRQYVQFLQSMFAKKHTHLKVMHINLLECLAGYLKKRDFLEKCEDMQKSKGDEALLKALK